MRAFLVLALVAALAHLDERGRTAAAASPSGAAATPAAATPAAASPPGEDPLEEFVPSEEIPADTAVPFPVDI